MCLLQAGESLAQGASVPALGLSNKAVFQGKPVDLYEGKEMLPVANVQYSESAFRSIELTGESYSVVTLY